MNNRNNSSVTFANSSITTEDPLIPAAYCVDYSRETYHCENKISTLAKQYLLFPALVTFVCSHY